MRQFAGLVAFELRYYLRAISTWVYLAVLAGISFLMVNLMGGAIPGAQAAIAGSDGTVHVNSPYVTLVLTASVGLFGILITAALAGHAGYRDFGEGTHPLLFTTPVSKVAYLGSRYVGTLLVNAVVLAGIGLGIWLGSLMPYLEADQFGPNRLSTFVMPYVTVVWPNLAFTAAIFLGLAALTRKRLPHYIGGVGLLVGYMLAGQLGADLENKWIAAMVDPFGVEAVQRATEYWTSFEKNTRALGLDGVLLQNRILWLGVSLLLVVLAVRLFRLGHADVRLRRKSAVDAIPDTPRPRPRRIELPSVTRNFGLQAQWLQFRFVMGRTVRDIVRNVYFIAILAAAVLFLVVSAFQVGKIYGTPTWPVTYQVLEVLGGTFALFIMIIVTFYAGELVWHERDLKLQQLVDTTPSPNWVPYLAKLTGLTLVVSCLMVVLWGTGVLTQLFNGYTNFEFGLYARTLYGMNLVDAVLLCVLAMAVHAVVNHKYVGHVVLIVFYGFTIFQSAMGLEHNLTQYGSDAGQTYSDMNGYGWFATPFLWFKLYWGSVAVLLSVLSNVFWVRGEEAHVGWRLKLAALRFRGAVAVGAGLAVTSALGAGGYIFYNTNILNEYRKTFDAQALSAEYERRYKQYEGLPQPRITDVDVAVDLYPRGGDVTAKGVLKLRNKTGEAIRDLHVRVRRQALIRDLSLDRGWNEKEIDREHDYLIYSLDEPMAPGEEAALRFDLAYETEGFAHDVSGAVVVENGSFVHSYVVVPGLGYTAGSELSADRDRKRHGLEPKERMRDLDDPDGRRNTYISSDSDWVTFRAVVGTSADQIAIAPGYLQEEWTEGGRRYFRYEMDAPILNFYAFLSARYEVRRDSWNDVAIEVYHHKGHEYNVERMIESVKKSLDYFTAEFSPYQHRQVRILEFPRYAAFAQSLPNTIPYSEAIGFIAKVGEDDIDYPLYVTAHEVAHQWWAHQVIGADVQGSTVLSETLSQYSAMMVMEKEYGPDKIRKFLRYELDDYLTGRSFERKKELPLLRVENQPYVHYNKGALVLYALRDAIGEEALNAALRRYIADVAFQEPPYTTARELLGYLREATPEDLHYVLEDLFEHVTLFENRAVEASWKKTEDGRYEVTLGLDARKVRAGEQGEETAVPLRDRIDIGVFGSDEEVLYLEKHLIADDTKAITVVVDAEPHSAGIDPYHKLIDRHPEDNEVRVKPASGT